MKRRRRSGPGGEGDGSWREGVASGLNGRCRPRGGCGEGGRALEGGMGRGGDDEGGMVGRAGGGKDGGTDGVAVGRMGWFGEGGGERVTTRGGKMERRLEGGRYVERRRNGDGRRDGESGRDGDGGGEELFRSWRNAGSQPPRVNPSIPHPSNCEERRERGRHTFQPRT